MRVTHLVPWRIVSEFCYTVLLQVIKYSSVFQLPFKLLMYGFIKQKFSTIV